ncbi:MAG: DNRLRE domain-containing protein [Sumerlaeia bacterium]
MKYTVSLLAAAALLPAVAIADLLTLTGPASAQDTAIFDDAPDSNGGAGTSVFSGRIRNGSGLRRALFQFDLSAIDSGATITSATLRLEIDRVPQTGSVNSDFGLHPITASWVPGTGASTGGGGTVENGSTSWNSRVHNSLAWTTGGGDFATTASATTNFGGSIGPVVFIGAGMVADLQDWIDNPGANNGWILISTAEGTNGTARSIASAEAASGRPVLEIEFTPQAGIPGWSDY